MYNIVHTIILYPDRLTNRRLLTHVPWFSAQPHSASSVGKGRAQRHQGDGGDGTADFQHAPGVRKAPIENRN